MSVIGAIFAISDALSLFALALAISLFFPFVFSFFLFSFFLYFFSIFSQNEVVLSPGV